MTSDAATTASGGDRSGPEFFTVDFGEYDNFPTLDAATEIDRVARQFEAFGAHRGPQWNQPPDARNWPEVKSRLESWVGSGAVGSILYWVGHGLSNRTHSGLAYSGSPRDPDAEKELVTPSDLARFIKERDSDELDDDHWALILIDACQSSRFVEQLSHELDEAGGPRRVLLLASSPQQAAATLGQLGAAIEQVVESMIHVPDVTLVRFGEAIKIALNPIGSWAPKEVTGVVLHNSRALPAGLQTTLDHAHELSTVIASLPEAERIRFRANAAGAELGATAWYFTGRVAELDQVGRWLSNGGPLLVITGSAGSGKSALLGNVLLRNNADVWRAMSPVVGADTGPDLSALPRIDAALRLTGATAEAVVITMARRVGLGAPAGTSIEEQTSWLISGLRSRSSTVILLDGLDEAHDVIGIGSLISRLAADGCARFVVGTRRSIQSAWGTLEPETADIILRLQGDIDDVETIVLARDPAALSTYVAGRLRAAADAGVPGLRRRIETASVQLGQAPDFLFARLAVLEVVAEPSLVDTGWLEVVRELGPAALFSQALSRLDEINPHFRPLLAALAERRGHGMPTELGVWLTAAQGFAEERDQPQTSDLVELLTDSGAPYLLVDGEFGSTAYRLAHRIFETELLREPE